MKLLAALSLVAWVTSQEPVVRVERTDDGQTWREMGQVPVSRGWVGFVFRDTTNHTAWAMRISWPVCVSTQRIGE